MSRMPTNLYLKKMNLLYMRDQMIEKEIDSIPIVKNKGNNKYQVTGRISKQQLQNYLYHYLRIGGRTMENIKIIIASDSLEKLLN